MNIYVGNLNYRVRENDLRQALEEFGTVSSVKIITDRDTGRSKGFAFVEMPNDQEAAEVIRQFNGQDFQGRAIVIKEARPRY
jgi:RNA recognition motif-containing protein